MKGNFSHSVNTVFAGRPSQSAFKKLCGNRNRWFNWAITKTSLGNYPEPVLFNPHLHYLFAEICVLMLFSNFLFSQCFAHSIHNISPLWPPWFQHPARCLVWITKFLLRNTLKCLLTSLANILSLYFQTFGIMFPVTLWGHVSQTGIKTTGNIQFIQTDW
jgi:hypothetical protein